MDDRILSAQEARRLLSRALREDRRSVRLQVHGDCMKPLIQTGDWVEVQPLGSEAGPGHVVLAEDADGELVCPSRAARPNW